MATPMTIKESIQSYMESESSLTSLDPHDLIQELKHMIYVID